MKPRQGKNRYMQETLGSEGFVDAYRERLKRALQGQSLTIAVREEAITKTGDAQVLSDRRVFAQKQHGLYAVYYHPIGGSLTPQKLQEIYDCIRDMEAVELRLTPQQVFTSSTVPLPRPNVYWLSQGMVPAIPLKKVRRVSEPPHVRWGCAIPRVC